METHTMRERPGPPRARRPWPIVCGKMHSAWGPGRRARGGPGQSCVGKYAMRDPVWENAQLLGNMAAARAAALARSVLENTPCANCQSSVGTCAKSRRAGCGPCPLCVGKHTVREGPGPRRARRPWPILCGNTRNAWVPGRRARGGPGPF